MVTYDDLKCVAKSQDFNLLTSSIVFASVVAN